MPTPDVLGFVRELLSDWPATPAGDDSDEWFLQALGEKYGVVVPEPRRTFCGDDCACAEAYAEGDTWTCFRLHPLIRPKPEGEQNTMPETPNNDLPRRERAKPEELRDWETMQDNGASDQTQRLMVVGGWLYRTVYMGQVSLTFVPGERTE